VKHLLGNRKSLHPSRSRSRPREKGVVRRRRDPVRRRLQTTNTLSFVNNINTHEGGTHLTGFRAALTRTINEWAKKDGILRKESSAHGG